MAGRADEARPAGGPAAGAVLRICERIGLRIAVVTSGDLKGSSSSVRR